MSATLKATAVRTPGTYIRNQSPHPRIEEERERGTGGRGGRTFHLLMFPNNQYEYEYDINTALIRLSSPTACVLAATQPTFSAIVLWKYWYVLYVSL